MRNAAFQQWQALLSNRVKRQRAGEFAILGVRPTTLAAWHRWPARAMIHDMSRPVSRWARDMLSASGARRVAMAPELLSEPGEKDGSEPEMVAVAAIPPDDLSRIPRARTCLPSRSTGRQPGKHGDAHLSGVIAIHPSGSGGDAVGPDFPHALLPVLRPADRNGAAR